MHQKSEGWEMGKELAGGCRTCLGEEREPQEKQPRFEIPRSLGVPWPVGCALQLEKKREGKNSCQAKNSREKREGGKRSLKKRKKKAINQQGTEPQDAKYKKTIGWEREEQFILKK